jgi:hypothetical protein
MWVVKDAVAAGDGRAVGDVREIQTDLERQTLH